MWLAFFLLNFDELNPCQKYKKPVFVGTGNQKTLFVPFDRRKPSIFLQRACVLTKKKRAFDKFQAFEEKLVLREI